VIVNCSVWKKFLETTSNVAVRGGTTLQVQIAVICDGSIPLSLSRLVSNRPYSSGNLLESEAVRIVVTNFVPSKTPIVTIVFPMSIANNIYKYHHSHNYTRGRKIWKMTMIEVICRYQCKEDAYEN
tara:strand:- start:167 stop:544 length:378 start_codon:yes stop_codon:yes gene_type:complete